VPQDDEEAAGARRTIHGALCSQVDSSLLEQTLNPKTAIVSRFIAFSNQQRWQLMAASTAALHASVAPRFIATTVSGSVCCLCQLRGCHEESP